MMSSVDGRIDCDMTEKIDDTDTYYDILNKLEPDACLEGRVSRQKHYALPEPFTTTDKTAIGAESVNNCVHEGRIEVAIDTHGTLRWPSSAAADNLLVVTDENCPRTYHEYLKAAGISYIATGKEGIDLARMSEILAESFGVKRLCVVGGGKINAAFLSAGLLDELIVMIGAGIDGRIGAPALFDGLSENVSPILLHLNEVSQPSTNTVVLKYSFAK